MYEAKCCYHMLVICSARLFSHLILQTLIYFYEPIEVEQDQQIEGSVTLSQSKENCRFMNIHLEYAWVKTCHFHPCILQSNSVIFSELVISSHWPLLQQIRWSFFCERVRIAMILIGNFLRTSLLLLLEWILDDIYLDQSMAVVQSLQNLPLKLNCMCNSSGEWIHGVLQLFIADRQEAEIKYECSV